MDQEHFKDTRRDFCIQEGFHIVIVKADKFRYIAECATVGCEWRIHASVLQYGSTWAIKSIRAADHGCDGVKSYNPLANVEWVAKKLIEDIMANPSITGESIQKLLMASAQFNGLIGGCRSLIRVDGTHLKGNHGGVLLSAIAVDGNNEIFPVAVGVVESESKESWSNLFWHLKQVLAESEREDWTIISDRQKGIEPALEQVWPSFYRRFCVRHLCKNFKKDYPGVLMHKLFWKLVNSYSDFTFKKTLESRVQHGGLGYGRWFSDLRDYETWARHRFDLRVSNDENTSNFVESFNSTLGIHRNNPVLSLLEGIRRISMVRHATRQQVAESWPDEGICPKIRKRLKVLKKESRFLEAFALTAKAEYEVRDGRTYLPVSLINRTCKCGQ